jgi:hypothetical protein
MKLLILAEGVYPVAPFEAANAAASPPIPYRKAANCGLSVTEVQHVARHRAPADRAAMPDRLPYRRPA